MMPKTFSASAALVAEQCFARYKAEYIDRAPDIQGEAGALGSACHLTLEMFVHDGHYIKSNNFDTLKLLWDLAYYNFFSDTSRYDEGLKMLKGWFDRQNWHGRKVLSTEVKETFDLKLESGIVLPFTYIWDRCDELDDGSIEVVDYKSISQPIPPEALKVRIQPRAYALAAQIKWPKAPRIWVSYDMLRYDVVSRVFTREDNVATWHYLRALAARVLAADGTEEQLNPDCRYCVRKGVCDTLNRHTLVGGVLGIDDPHEAADRRATLDYAVKALKKQINDLDEFLLDYAKREEIQDFATEATGVKITAKSKREIDPMRAATILGPELMAKYGNIGVTAIDAILKNEVLTDEQRSMLKMLATKTWGNPYIVTTPKTPLHEEI
jgi:hypothetical protein